MAGFADPNAAASDPFDDFFGDRWMPFVRAGYADDGGAPLEATVAITPDVQLIINPPFNTDKDVIAVFGVRARLAF